MMSQFTIRPAKESDAEAMLEKDSQVAEEFDRRMKEGWEKSA